MVVVGGFDVDCGVESENIKMYVDIKEGDLGGEDGPYELHWRRSRKMKRESRP